MQTVPRPVLNSAAISNGKIALSWGAFMNASYQIQSSTNLGVSGWSNLGSAILATNNSVNLSLPIGNAQKQFYRVVLSP